MKQVKCEMCDSTNFVKQDGMFVCQDCGTKYSVEEAKKLMVEVEGASPAPAATSNATADNGRLNNLYELARRAKDNNNSEGAAKYYEMILIEDPSNWEANFYTTYFKAMSCKIAQIESAAISISNCLDTILELIHNYVSDETEQAAAVAEVTTRCISIANMLFNAAENHYNGIDFSIRSKYTQEYLDNCCAARNICYNVGDYILNIFGTEGAYKNLCIVAWKDGVAKHQKLLPRFANQQINKNTIDSYIEKVGALDAGYKLTKEQEALNAKKRELKNQIDEISRSIGNTDVVGKSKGGMIGLGVFFIICAIIMIGAGSSFSGGGAFVAIGVIEVIIAIVCFAKSKPNKSVIEANIQRVKELQARRDKLRQELAELEGK